MRIFFSPQRRDDTLVVSKKKDVLTINGEEFDFSSLPDGASIPAGEVPCEWIVGPVRRINGKLVITMLLPHSQEASSAARKPTPLFNPRDGVLSIPRG